MPNNFHKGLDHVGLHGKWRRHPMVTFMHRHSMKCFKTRSRFICIDCIFCSRERVWLWLRCVTTSPVPMVSRLMQNLAIRLLAEVQKAFTEETKEHTKKHTSPADEQSVPTLEQKECTEEHKMPAGKLMHGTY